MSSLDSLIVPRPSGQQKADSRQIPGLQRVSRRASDFPDFAPVVNTNILVPQALASHLSAMAGAADLVWASMRHGGRPDVPMFKDPYSDLWQPLEPEVPSSSSSTVPESASAAEFPSTKKPARKLRNQVEIYDLTEVEAGKKDLSARIADRERTKQRTALLDQMIALGPMRTLAQPRRSWPVELNALAQTYPNFHAVVDYLQAEFALREAGRRPLGFAPFVVHGPPGIGKSVFMEGLAQVLRTKFHRVQGETAQHSSCLIGTDKHWSNAEAGAVFNALVLEGVANPVIYIDEIDKAGAGSERSIASALYALLEDGSAKAFRDVSMPEIQLDASHVQWVFAANDIRKVPAAIRSRWTEFAIPAMSPSDARRVVQGIYEKLKQEYRIKGLEPLAEEDLNVLASKAPREMRALLRQAIARAVHERKTRVELRHLLPQARAAGTTLAVPEDRKLGTQEAERLYLLLDTAIDLMTGAGRVLH